MTREEIIEANPILRVLEDNGVKLIGAGNQRTAKCPFHADGSPSFSVNVSEGIWHCHAGCGGGSVIDLLAKFRNVTPRDIIAQHGNGHAKRFDIPTDKPIEVCSYKYTDANGKTVYEVVRYKPKTFRQRRVVDGKTVWGMDGVERVLYRLHMVINAEEIWICEGEKDADALHDLGFVATCNVGGAGKWLDGYNETLTGKRVVICGDNDKPGRDHVALVSEQIGPFAKEVRIVTVPSPFKDAFEFIRGTNDAKEQLAKLRDSERPLFNGVRLHISHIADLEPAYSKYAVTQSGSGLNLGKWLPGFIGNVRQLVPGELVVFLGGTGVGKTAILSNIAVHAMDTPTLFFELELPSELLFERLVSLKMGFPCIEVEKSYATGDTVGREILLKQFPKLFISTESRLSVESIEHTISKASLMIGERPKVVLVDYIGLITAKGHTRYDRVSQIAEDLKVMAKATETIVICASQISRKGPEDSAEVTLRDGKDSGSIENSAGLVIGAWRDEDDRSIMHMRILKNTKGMSGRKIECDYNPDTLKISQRNILP
jgi:KaiC/GvpD/RAD55 family RecA-like ATPase